MRPVVFSVIINTCLNIFMNDIFNFVVDIVHVIFVHEYMQINV